MLSHLRQKIEESVTLFGTFIIKFISLVKLAENSEEFLNGIVEKVYV